jgi:hypothetical protein
MPIVQTTTAEAANGEIAILGRVLGNGKDFTPALARHLLKLGFSDDDIARINDLAARNQQNALSGGEQAQLRDYANAGCLLGILHAKARRALKNAARK